MNKKIEGFILVLFATVFLLTPMVGLVQAGKGQEKLDFTLYINRVDEGFADRVIRTSPKGSRPPMVGGDANLVFVEIEYIAAGLSVDIGSTSYSPTDVELVEGVRDLAVHWNPPKEEDPQMVIVKDVFTLDFTELFGEPASIEFKRVGKSYFSLTGPTGVAPSSSLVGIGGGSLKGVKVTGIQTDVGAYTGTIMGWPDLP